MPKPTPSNERTYKVLLPIQDEIHGFPVILNLGEAAKGTAEASVAAVLDRLGSEAAENFALTEAVAVPTGNWNLCDVEEDPRPRFKVRRRITSTTGGDGEPTPEPESAPES